MDPTENDRDLSLATALRGLAGWSAPPALIERADKWAAAHKSKRHEWRTPRGFVAAVEDAWGVQFTLDAAAAPSSAQAPVYYTEADDALTQPWPGVVWLNPPYGRALGKWVAKALSESREAHCDAVYVLTFARTDTKWWHAYVSHASEVVLLKGRLKFGHPDTGEEGAGAPAPSALIVYRRSPRPGGPVYSLWDWRAKGQR